MRLLALWVGILLVANSSVALTEPAIPAASKQLVLVITSDWDAPQGTMYTYERVGREWRATRGPTTVTIGRKGSAWGVGLHDSQDGPQKVEGDGRSPAGVFAIGTAFGYDSKVRSGLAYRAMSESDYCIDVNASPLYNQIVDANTVGKSAIEGSTEPMRRDLHLKGDQRYKLGFVIEHNPKRVSTKGSCIFAHLWGAPGMPTAGCTAMNETEMQELLAWLDDSRQPTFVLLPEAEYQRLASDWQLPSDARVTR